MKKSKPSIRQKEIEETLEGIKMTDRVYAHKNGSQIKATKLKDGHYEARVTFGGNFWDPLYTLAKAFNEALDKAHSVQPLKEVDPKTLPPASDLNYWEQRRFLAAKLARKYYNFSNMKKYARWLRQGKPLTMLQCAYIINEARRIREWLATQGEKK